MNKTLLLKRKVYDPFQRTLHWVIALATIVLMLTGFGHTLVEEGAPRKQLWSLHIKAGYVLLLALMLRFIWAFIGPRFARARDFFKLYASPNSFGHNPKAALAYLLFYGMLILIGLSGLGLAGIEHNKGPLALHFFDRLDWAHWLLPPHLYLAYGILAFSCLHLGALLWHQHRTGIPMLQAMFTGTQYRLKTQQAIKTKELSHE